MDAKYAKTAAGRREIEDRALRLAPTLRAILLVVDGKRSDTELAEVVAGLRAPDDALRQLAALGLIEREGPAEGAPAPPPPEATATVAPPEVERYHLLYGWMSETVRRRLGLRGYFMQLKIERCADAEALRALWPEMAEALRKHHDEGTATRWLQESHALLAGDEQA